MSAQALKDLGTSITALRAAIDAASKASTFNMKPAINAVLIAAVNVNAIAAQNFADHEARLAALEGRGNAAT